MQKNTQDESAAETSSNKPIAHTKEIVERSPSVRTGKMHILLCYIFVYYVNSTHAGLFGSRKPRGQRSPFIKS